MTDPVFVECENPEVLAEHRQACGWGSTHTRSADGQPWRLSMCLAMDGPQYRLVFRSPEGAGRRLVDYRDRLGARVEANSPHGPEGWFLWPYPADETMGALYQRFSFRIVASAPATPEPEPEPERRWHRVPDRSVARQAEIDRCRAAAAPATPEAPERTAGEEPPCPSCGTTSINCPRGGEAWNEPCPYDLPAPAGEPRETPEPECPECDGTGRYCGSLTSARPCSTCAGRPPLPDGVEPADLVLARPVPVPEPPKTERVPWWDLPGHRVTEGRERPYEIAPGTLIGKITQAHPDESQPGGMYVEYELPEISATEVGNPMRNADGTVEVLVRDEGEQ